jgi:hypothetical protein
MVRGLKIAVEVALESDQDIRARGGATH